MINLIHGDAFEHVPNLERHDLLLTDPPFDLDGQHLQRLIANAPVDHVVLLGTLRQIVAACATPGYTLAFDLVLDAATPKDSKSYRQPHYTHTNVVYLRQTHVASIFDRRRGQREDAFSASYWPSIVRAPRDRVADGGYAKNEQAITDIMAAFAAGRIIDPFAGTCTTGIAACNNGCSATLIDHDRESLLNARDNLMFIGGDVKAPN
ncbi:hypothetical protein HKX42_00070 [Salinisphaera sp. USBA-960]|nr:hypothetical protein [Salifodinibacter halophilus]NNC25286.1 hypothetical protein [Salifodinibacter halophilus]